MKILIVFLLILWVYMLSVFKRANLYFFKFIVGAVGLFFFTIIILQPYLVGILSQLVTAVAGIIGEITNYYQAFYQYSLILISSGTSNVSMYIDYECSGVIEILAFTSLLWFFPVYSTMEKIMYNIIGVIWIFMANVLRIFTICILVYYYGNNIFYFAHTILARFIFYGLSIILYFHVFTKAQIKKQRVGDISYGDNVK